MIISFLYTQLLTKVDSWRDSANTEQAQLALAAPSGLDAAVARGGERNDGCVLLLYYNTYLFTILEFR